MVDICDTVKVLKCDNYGKNTTPKILRKIDFFVVNSITL